MKELDFSTFDGKSIKVHVWDNAENPKGVVQIFHGMAEHSLRYAVFAEFLNANGFLVYSDDHRAHGKSAGGVTRQGITDGDIFEQTLRDEQDLSDYILKKHNLPLFIFGHSYGSFIAQKYIQSFGDKISGVVLSGSNRMKGALLNFGSLLANTACVFKGKDAVSKLIIKSSFGAYDKKFKGKNLWLSSVKEETDKYDADEFCGKHFSCGFYKYFFKGLKGLYTKKGLNAIPKTLPVIILSGADDPVGDYSKGVKRLHNTYKKLGLENTTLKLYEGGRHEMLNEEERNEVMTLVKDFFVEHLLFSF